MSPLCASLCASAYHRRTASVTTRANGADWGARCTPAAPCDTASSARLDAAAVALPLAALANARQHRVRREYREETTSRKARFK